MSELSLSGDLRVHADLECRKLYDFKIFLIN